MITTFNDYKEAAWINQLTSPELVAEEMKTNFKLMESADDVMWIAGFIVFIFGERLGKWQEGIELLRKLKNNAVISDKAQMKRLVGILNLGNNPNTLNDDYTNFSNEDKFIIFSATARALASLGAVKNAQKILDEAIELKVNKRSDDLQRAHVKLSLNYLKTEKIVEAKLHADAALEMIINSGTQDEALDLFDAYYVLTKINLSENNKIGTLSSLNGMRVAFDKLDTPLQELNQTMADQIENQIELP